MYRPKKKLILLEIPLRNIYHNLKHDGNGGFVCIFTASNCKKNIKNTHNVLVILILKTIRICSYLNLEK